MFFPSGGGITWVLDKLLDELYNSSIYGGSNGIMILLLSAEAVNSTEADGFSLS